MILPAESAIRNVGLHAGVWLLATDGELAAWPVGRGLDVGIDVRAVRVTARLMMILPSGLYRLAVSGSGRGCA
jgi:hypothetical protein